MTSQSANWRRLAAPYSVFVLLIVATVSWRKGAYFDGVFDSVVVIKAALSVIALGLAVAVTRRRPIRQTPAYPFLFLGLYLLTSLLGASATSSPIPSGVIVVRMVVIFATVSVLAARTDPLELVGTLIAALASVGGFAALTGLSNLGTEGRLWGGVPPLHPNEVAFMSALVLVWCLTKLLHGVDRLPHLLGVFAAAVVLVLTGSRTSWLTLALGLLITLLHARAVRLRTLWLALAGIPLLVYLAFGTSIAADAFRRGSSDEQMLTLSNRTIAWQAALSPKATAWLDWLGGGLAMKRVEVPGQWWTEQILDSSWVSTVVQGGIIGAAICVLWILFALVRGWRSTRGPMRGLLLGILSYLTFRGVAESGLFDASTSFMVLIACQLAMPAGYRRTRAVELPSSYASQAEVLQAT